MDRQRGDVIRDYLKDSALPILPSAVIEEIEHPITIKELGRVVAALPMGKCPGPDGLTIAYYKKCISILASPLRSYFNSINASNLLLLEAPMAYVTVLPKSGDDL